MIKNIRMLLMSFISFPAFASAGPQVEPRLARLLQENSESRLQVVFTYQSSRPERILNRQGLQIALMKQAEVSQSRSTLFLKHLATRESSVRFRSFWLGNTLLVSAPARVLREILNDENLIQARLMAKVFLIAAAPSSERAEPAGFTWGLEKIGIPALRQKFPELDGRGVRIGILDTGIDADHQDLHGKVLAFGDFSEKENRPYDDHGHGTHVAGTIAGGNRSGSWIGVAPKAGLVVGKIFDEWGSADEIHMLAGMQWMADPDGNPATNDFAQVVSNSWGSSIPGGNPADHALCRAVDDWVKLGMLPVFAAGNHGPKAPSVSVPAACPSALAVGATDENDVIAKFSSRGPVVWSTGTFLKPEISAPGVKVLSSGINGRYVTMSGTSMATPHVAGVAALLYQLNPKASPQEIGQRLRAGSIDLGSTGPDPVYGSGRMDALKSVESLRFR